MVLDRACTMEGADLKGRGGILGRVDYKVKDALETEYRE